MAPALRSAGWSVWRVGRWLMLLLLVLPVLAAAAWISLMGWNWARAPLQNLTERHTGRQLLLAGDLHVTGLDFSSLRLTADSVTFSNPSWATQAHMLAVKQVALSVNLKALLMGHLAFDMVRLVQPTVFLERAADGRKTWLLDRQQSDENARIPIARLMLDEGRLGYDDAALNTHLLAEVSTFGPKSAPPSGPPGPGVLFNASGLYLGLPLQASGQGAAVLTLQDELAPYHLKLQARVGHTTAQIEGTVTSLSQFNSLDVQLQLAGNSLADLYPLIGVVMPHTLAYRTSGHLLHQPGLWRYQGFSGHVGQTDVGGTLQLDVGAARPFLHGEVASRRLRLADLGPMVGAKPAGQRSQRLLPDMPFQSDRWGSVNADVHLRAQTLVQGQTLPLQNLQTHVLLQDGVLTLAPMTLQMAGGQVQASIVLDSRVQPIRANARISARRLQLARLLPQAKLTGIHPGLIQADLELHGQGNSVAALLAHADGNVSAVVRDGQVSRLLMERMGLHLLTVLRLSLTGDTQVRLRCAVADFGVQQGVMQARTLLVDTDVSTVVGQGHISLAQETLDLTLQPRTRVSTPVALRSPIYLRGSWAKPVVQLDSARIVARGGLALALATLNPLLLLAPLLELGPGTNSECDSLLRRLAPAAATR